MPSHRDQDSEHELPEGISPISDSDYFLKNAEFTLWLKRDKKKYFDELSSEKARSYFRKFVKAWNTGKLPTSLYKNAGSSTALKQTGYKWSFASKTSEEDERTLKSVRDDIDSATYARDSRGATSATGSSSRVHGPTLPSASDLVLARESAAEHQAAEQHLKRKRDRAEAKDRIEDMVGPKAIGKEGMLEKKRARRENDKAFREKGEDGFEADESTLLGGGDSFKDHLARRELAQRRRAATREDKQAETRERAKAMREKEKATMDMFQQLAKQRFG